MELRARGLGFRPNLLNHFMCSVMILVGWLNFTAKIGVIGFIGFSFRSRISACIRSRMVRPRSLASIFQTEGLSDGLVRGLLIRIGARSARVCSSDCIFIVTSLCHTAWAALSFGGAVAATVKAFPGLLRSSPFKISFTSLVEF